MIGIRDGRILIDGKPRLIIGGEVHYFRLKHEDWQDRDGCDKEFHLTEGGDARARQASPLLVGRSILLRRRQGLMLPINVSFGDVRIAYSTAEIVGVASEAMEFCLSQDQDVIAIQTDRQIVPSEGYEVSGQGKMKHIMSRKPAKVDRQLTIRWK